MSIQEVVPEELARLVHHYQQALAPDFDVASNFEGWEQVSPKERNRLVAAARMALLELAACEKKDSRHYFAKPGEAEWGC